MNHAPLRGEGTDSRVQVVSDPSPPIVVYTAVFAAYDYVPRPRWAGDGVDFICFTDDESAHLVREPWRKILIERGTAAPSMMNRQLKILGHPELQKYDASMYIDANIALRGDPRSFVRYALQECPMAVPAHPERNCVYDEAEACVTLGKLERSTLDAYLEALDQMQYPRNQGLGDNSIVIRRLADPAVQGLCSAWWRAVVAGPPRDQLHLLPSKRRLGSCLSLLNRDQAGVARLVLRLPHRDERRRLAHPFFAALASRFPTPAGIAMESLYVAYRRLRGLSYA